MNEKLSRWMKREGNHYGNLNRWSESSSARSLNWRENKEVEIEEKLKNVEKRSRQPTYHANSKLFFKNIKTVSKHILEISALEPENDLSLQIRIAHCIVTRLDQKWPSHRHNLVKFLNFGKKNSYKFWDRVNMLHSKENKNNKKTGLGYRIWSLENRRQWDEIHNKETRL